MKLASEWEPITHLIHLGLNNHDNLEWDIHIDIYTDKESKMLRGMPIGTLTAKGFVANPDDDEYTYKMIWTNENKVIFFRKKLIK